MEFERATHLRLFVDEADEHLADVEDALLELQARPDDLALVRRVFRSAHSIKGNASLLDLQGVVALAHAAEALLSRCSQGAQPLEPTHLSLLFGWVDQLRRALPRLIAGEQPIDDQALELVAALEASAGGEQPVKLSSAVALARDDGHPSPRERRSSLRVAVERLDRMLNLFGEIVIGRGQIARMLAQGAASAAVLDVHVDLDPLYAELQDLLIGARTVAIGQTFRQFRRTVRDIASAHRKQVRLELRGEEVEFDSLVLDRIRDPLIHLLRNAVDHGIEPPEDRYAIGKPREGCISLSARYDGSSVVVEIADDGVGLDRERMAARGRELGLLKSDAASAIEIEQLLFAPGFSTAEVVTDLSGRGIGMDIVRREIELLRGTIGVSSTRGSGTRFTIRLPLTLAIIKGLAVRVGDERFVVPMDAVAECIDLDGQAASGDVRGGVFNLRGEALPYTRLRALFDVCSPKCDRESLVVVDQQGLRAGVAVDRLDGEMQVVVKPMGPLFRHVPAVCGATILGEGQVALILDVPPLLRAAVHGSPLSGDQRTGRVRS
jgi:two-component system chemotaxis sensor kinase CheA